MKIERETGYYWCYGNSCYHRKTWRIYWWSGSMFWEEGDDFSEETFEKIDERQIVRAEDPNENRSGD